MPRVFSNEQTIITLDEAGLYDEVEMLRAAVGWLLQAARDTDLLAQRGTELWQVASAVATTPNRGLVGHAFENAVVDLLTRGSAVLPQLQQAVALSLEYLGAKRDFSRPRVIAVVANRKGRLLRTDLGTAERLVSDDARLLTPAAGRPVGLRGSRSDRLAELLASSTSGSPPKSLTPTVSMLHHADLLIGSNDGLEWVAVDVKSGDSPCGRSFPGVHFGVSELRRAPIWESQYEPFQDTVRGRGTVVTFVEVRVGTRATAIARLREALRVVEDLAAVRENTDTSKLGVSSATAELLAELKPMLTAPVDDAITY
ncbi:MAG TPA: hypothetical protein VGW38_13260, partial [Chloroflexota bacterium]|nr:hypothetical protein [Chloroflexota bacterium]